MKKVTNFNLILFCIGIVIGMLVVGLSKPTYIIERPTYTYTKVSDWASETNPRKVAYFEHLVRTQP